MQLLAALAALAPWGYERYQTFSAMFENRPGKLQNFNGFASHEVKFRNELANCEDVLVEEGMGIAFLSCNPERDQWNTVMVSAPVVYMPDHHIVVFIQFSGVCEC